MMEIAKEGGEGGFSRKPPTKMKDGCLPPQDLRSFRLLQAAAASVLACTPTINRAAAAPASVTAACVAATAVCVAALATSVAAPLATSVATARSGGGAATALG